MGGKIELSALRIHAPSSGGSRIWDGGGGGGGGGGGRHNGRCGYRWGRVVSSATPGRVPPSYPARGYGGAL